MELQIAALSLGEKHSKSDQLPTRRTATESLTQLQKLVYTQIHGDQEIRVLDIHRAPAASLQDPLHCTLRVVSSNAQGSTSDSPESPQHEYLTLSYCWGPTYPDGSHLTHAICVNGCSLKISANLHAALTRVRQKLDEGDLKIGPQGTDARLPIWIDAICINQSDNIERSQQVAQMAHIYTSSYITIIWLGEHATSAENAEETRLWHRIFQRYDELQHEISSAKPRYPDWIERRPDGAQRSEIMQDIMKRSRADSSSEENSFIAKILGLPWFSRRWVVQECILSSRLSVLLGQHLAKAEAFEQMIYALGAPPDNTLRLGLKTKVGQLKFLEVLQQFDRQECHNDLDRVYALASIADDYHAVVDYSLSAEDLYTSIAEAFVESGRVVELLAVAITRLSWIPHRQLPSWVPDWRRPASKKHTASVRSILGLDHCHTRGANLLSGHGGTLGSRQDTLEIRCWLVVPCRSGSDCDAGSECICCKINRTLSTLAGPVPEYNERHEQAGELEGSLRSEYDRLTERGLSAGSLERERLPGSAALHYRASRSFWEKWSSRDKAYRDEAQRFLANLRAASPEDPTERHVCVIQTGYYVVAGFVVQTVPERDICSDKVVYRLCPELVLGSLQRAGSEAVWDILRENPLTTITVE